jgi:hypothetical protein
MACGRAVVAPDAGGIPNLMSHGKTGFLFRPGDLPGAVELTRNLLADEGLRNRVGQAARRQIEECDWEQSIRRVREVYADAIKSWQDPPRLAPHRWTWRQRLAQTTTSALVSAFRAVPSKSKNHGIHGKHGNMQAIR